MGKRACHGAERDPGGAPDVLHAQFVPDKPGNCMAFMAFIDFTQPP